MEKSMKPKATKIISFIRKSTTFTGAAGHHHHHSHGGEFWSKTSRNHRPYRRGLSGPMAVSIVPAESLNKSGNGKGEGEFETGEPTSPKVSCIGQIKKKKKAMKDMCKRQPAATPQPPEKKENKIDKNKKASSGFHKMIRRKVRPGKEPDGGERTTTTNMEATARAPTLGQMKRFASGHETLGSFDWSKVERVRERGEEAGREVYCTGDVCYLRSRETDDEEEGLIIPHSAPIIVGDGGTLEVEPKKEINLWKRRSTFAPVSPLRLS